MGALTIPVNFLAHLDHEPRPGEVARAMAAAELFSQRADKEMLGDAFISCWADHDAPYVRHVQFTAYDPDLREALEALVIALLVLCWRDAGTIDRTLQ